MAALDVLEVVDGVALVAHLGHHLPGVAGMDPVVPGRGPEEGIGVVGVLLHQVVGGPLLDVGPVLGVVGVAVLRHPARPGQELVVAPHVQEGYCTDHGAEQVRTQGHGAAHEEAALGAAPDTEMLGGGDSPVDEVLGHRDEVLEVPDVVLLDRGLVPGRTELASAPRVGQDEDPAPGQPGDAPDPAVGGGPGDLEAAVGR